MDLVVDFVDLPYPRRGESVLHDLSVGRYFIFGDIAVFEIENQEAGLRISLAEVGAEYFPGDHFFRSTYLVRTRMGSDEVADDDVGASDGYAKHGGFGCHLFREAGVLPLWLLGWPDKRLVFDVQPG